MGSDNGLSLINTLNGDVTEIYDSLFVPRQILVEEEKSIAIVRAEKGYTFQTQGNIFGLALNFKLHIDVV